MGITTTQIIAALPNTVSFGMVMLNPGHAQEKLMLCGAIGASYWYANYQDPLVLRTSTVQHHVLRNTLAGFYSYVGGNIGHLSTSTLPKNLNTAIALGDVKTCSLDHKSKYNDVAQAWLTFAQSALRIYINTIYAPQRDYFSLVIAQYALGVSCELLKQSLNGQRLKFTTALSNAVQPTVINCAAKITAQEFTSGRMSHTATYYGICALGGIATQTNAIFHS